METCQHCGFVHSTICPKIKSIEYHQDGITIKKIEYHEQKFSSGIEKIELVQQLPRIWPPIGNIDSHRRSGYTPETTTLNVKIPKGGSGTAPQKGTKNNIGINPPNASSVRPNKPGGSCQNAF